MSGYPDSHLGSSHGPGATGLRRILFLAIPLLAAAAWLIYFWSITGVHTVVEKFPNGTTKAAGYVQREGVESYKKHGHWVTFHENGQKESEGFYRHGEKSGTWSYWDASGRPIGEPPASTQPTPPR